MCDIAVGMTWDINNFVNISHCCLLSTVCMLVSTATGTISSSPPIPQPPYEIVMRVDGMRLTSANGRCPFPLRESYDLRISDARRGMCSGCAANWGRSCSKRHGFIVQLQTAESLASYGLTAWPAWQAWR